MVEPYWWRVLLAMSVAFFAVWVIVPLLRRSIQYRILTHRLNMIGLLLEEADTQHGEERRVTLQRAKTLMVALAKDTRRITNG